MLSFAKAIVAAIGAGLSALVALLVVSNTVSFAGWVTVAIATVSTFAVTYFVPNTPTRVIQSNPAPPFSPQ